MKFLKSNILLTLSFFIAILGYGSVSIADISNSPLASFEVLKDNKQLIKKTPLATPELKTSYQVSNAFEFEDDNFDDDDGDEAISSFETYKLSYHHSSVLENSLSRKIGFAKIPFYILFCSLKLPFII